MRHEEDSSLKKTLKDENDDSEDYEEDQKLLDKLNYKA